MLNQCDIGNVCEEWIRFQNLRTFHSNRWKRKKTTLNGFAAHTVFSQTVVINFVQLIHNSDCYFINMKHTHMNRIIPSGCPWFTQVTCIDHRRRKSEKRSSSDLHVSFSFDSFHVEYSFSTFAHNKLAFAIASAILHGIHSHTSTTKWKIQCPKLHINGQIFQSTEYKHKHWRTFIWR